MKNKLLLALVAGVLVVRHGSPWDEQHISDANLSLVRVLSGPAYRGAVILAKPSRALPPDWILEGRVTFLALPAAVPESERVRWVVERAQYVLESPDLLRSRPELFASKDASGAESAFDPPWLEPTWEPGLLSLLRVVPGRVPR